MKCFFLVIYFYIISSFHAFSQWTLNGNANATNSSKLGTTNNIPVRLVTNNLERIRIEANTGKVGINSSLPIGRLHVNGGGSVVQSNWASANAIITAFGENQGGSGDVVVGTAATSAGVRSVLSLRRSRGTLAAPAPVMVNDVMGSIIAAGYDGAQFQNPAAIDFIADQPTTLGSTPAAITFSTGTAFGTRRERVRIGSNGNININEGTLFISRSFNGETGVVGIGTANPSGAKLRVNGGQDNGAGIFATGSLFAIRAVGGEMDGSAIQAEGIGNAPALIASAQNEAPAVIAVPAASGTGFQTYNGTTGMIAEGSDFGVVASGDVYAGSFNGDVFSTGVFTTSDNRYKRGAEDLKGALALVAALKPKHYQFRQNENLRLPSGTHYGLMAQDLITVLPGLVKETQLPTMHNKNGVAHKVGPTEGEAQPKQTMLAVNYTELIPILVKSTQEQQEQIAALQNEITTLKNLVAQLTRTDTERNQKGALGVASPNPVNNSTLITYTLPNDVRTAHLLLTDMKGSTLRQVTLTSRGPATYNLQTADLAAGTYTYSLHADGVRIDSKQILITR